MALSDFMPYGAPELLDAAPARMARSTLVANLAVTLMVASVGLVTSRSIPTVTLEPDEIRVYTILDPLRPQELEPAPDHVEPAKPDQTIDEHANVEPRADTDVPPSEPERIGPSVGPEGEGPGPDIVIPGTGTGTAPVPDPQPGEFVYTDEMPALVSAPELHYPDLARDAGVEGTVTVQMLVGLDGRVLRAVLAPRGSVPMLDEAALTAARGCVFTPALANGRPVKAWVSQQYRFRLH